MRKSQLLIVFILIIACLCACTNVEIHGIENFDQATCSVGLTKNLFPGEGFLESYDYLESDYYYFDACELVWGYAEAYAILTYDERIYPEAKAYCLERFALCELHQYVCEQYTFYEVKNADSHEVDSSGDVACNFPGRFMRSLAANLPRSFFSLLRKISR